MHRDQTLIGNLALVSHFIPISVDAICAYQIIESRAKNFAISGIGLSRAPIGALDKWPPSNATQASQTPWPSRLGISGSPGRRDKDGSAGLRPRPSVTVTVSNPGL